MNSLARWVFDIVLMLGLPVLGWLLLTTIDIQQVQAEQGTKLAQAETQATEARGAQTSLQRQVSDIENKVEKIHGEQKVERQITCAILHEVSPGARCPEVER